ncbi:hypothetical protein PRIPAC_92029 [Pristionchus pacificus]|uniref:Uncharacterized protein n=1 Tax=Pristionchus pacificus TaxID=54126 RepID=A0A2A6BQG0_PRIPA|nr:hypothetical protein PRIPAC_92029 [Pristionchus pacificus]|eukprot:PDM68150.1 hypothetical protein PRIPAC_46194 [Pristionchus pacificus]
MADSPDRNPSINNGRSLFINWLWQPIISMFGRRVEQKEMVSAKCNGLMYKQQGESLNNDAKSDGNEDYAPTTVEGNCAGVDNEERIDSPFDQVNLNDLPLPPLLEICKFLRADWYPESLSNFRKTCRATAHAVNVSHENQANLPKISTENEIKLVVSLERFNYFMHPLKEIRDEIKGQLYFRHGDAIIHICFAIEHDDSLEQAFEQAAQYLRGPVDTLDLSFPENANNKFDKSIQLLQNITFEKIQITGRLTREVGSLVLELLRKQSQPKVFIASYFGVPSIFSPEFLTELDSLSKCMTLRDDNFNFPGVPNAFWQQLLMQKLGQGSQVLYWPTRVTLVPNRFTANSDLTPSHIRIYEVQW